MRSRSKTIVVRLTQDEYENLPPGLPAAGSRGFEDRARAKVLRAVGESSLIGIARKLDELERAVAQLTHALSRAQVIPHGREQSPQPGADLSSHAG